MSNFNLNLKNALEERVEKILKVVVLEVEAQVKAESPVDTGRFRSNWFTTEGKPSTETTKATTPKGPYTGEIKLGKTYYIVNNLPYAERLANGYSKQAKAGWLDIIAANAVNRAKGIK